jgi:4'-phosphopantetheinyl transferase
VEPDHPARLVEVVGQPDEPARWSLLRLAPAPGYVAALAVAGQDWQLRCWRPA